MREKAKGPEEWDSPQIAHEQGRVSDGRKQPANIADEKNEKDRNVRYVFSFAVRAQRGLMRSIAAPVVPNRLAMIAPMMRKSVLFFGVARMSPLKNIPPEIMKREPSNTIKEKYSRSS